MSDKIKIKDIISGAEQLSLGISIVVAILLGVGLGIWLKNLTGLWPMVLLGAFFGVSAAIYNVFLAYKKQKASLDELKDRYKIKTDLKEDEA